MTDNEIILQLQTELFEVLNKSKMPLAVKALVTENALLKLYAEISKEREKLLRENQEVNLHVDTLELNTGAAE